MKTIGVIPARYQSSRFPGKPLIDLAGKPMIIWVCELVEKALGHDNTYVATDDARIKNAVEHYGYNVVMTSDRCKTGTDRLWEVAEKINADIYVNIQGDEPLLNPEDIIKIVNFKKQNMDFVINGATKLSSEDDPHSINIPKVVFSKETRDLLYMSRKAIPGVKSVETSLDIEYWKQVCIYAFTYKELELFGERSEKTFLENYEDIEILRFLELGHKIKIVETSDNTNAVDCKEDVALVEELLKQR